MIKPSIDKAKFMMGIVNFGVSGELQRQLAIATATVFTYLGVITMLRGQEEFTLMIPFITLDTKGSGEELILLDTSVIIDGRIADIPNELCPLEHYADAAQQQYVLHVLIGADGERGAPT